MIAQPFRQRALDNIGVVEAEAEQQGRLLALGRNKFHPAGEHR